MSGIRKFEVEINYSVVAEIAEKCMGQTNEIAGVLIGEWIPGPPGILKIIAQLMGEGSEMTSDTFVALTDESLVSIVQKVSARTDDLSIVGWWHSHPGMSTDFFSQQDQDTQRIYQNLFSSAVGLVVDYEKEITSLDQLDLRVYQVRKGIVIEIPFKLMRGK
ncbi:MAG: Mov34/MPN/PAD-1 family protein [Candidatus Kariarchaeaceae archaeon]